MINQGQHPQLRNPKPLVFDDLDKMGNSEAMRMCVDAAGCSQRQFAKVMGTQESTLSEWLSNTRPPRLLAVRAAILALVLMGHHIQLPNPSRYLSPAGKRRARK